MRRGCDSGIVVEVVAKLMSRAGMSNSLTLKPQQRSPEDKHTLMQARVWLLLSFYHNPSLHSEYDDDLPGVKCSQNDNSMITVM